MAHLIQMRQRIKAIETIKKITHAMRLISMSHHSRLRSKEEPLAFYTKKLSHLFGQIKSATPDWHNETLYPSPSMQAKTLVILVGSQKGLCGNFNTALYKEYERYSTYTQLDNIHYIAIGKKSIDYITDHIQQQGGTFVQGYPSFSAITLTSIVKSIVEKIAGQGNNYTNVLIFSNKAKTFFIQKAHITQLIPFIHEHDVPPASYDHQGYEWEQSPTAILDLLALQSLEAMIHLLLFQSLLSEQSARFLSMDSSTRNAESLLQTTRLQYNKLRQAKITKELTELSGSI